MQESALPLFTAIDGTLRIVMVFFLLAFAIRFRNWLVLTMIAISSFTIYNRFILGKDGTLPLIILGQITAFLVVYALYDWMRLKYFFKNAERMTAETMESITHDIKEENHIAREDIKRLRRTVDRVKVVE